MSNELEVVGVDAEVRQSLEEISASQVTLADLETRFKGAVFATSTTAGMTAAKEARAEIRSLRYAVERRRKDAKRRIAQFGKSVDERAGTITDLILSLEKPIDAQIEAEENRKEEERRRKRAEEDARIAGINAAVKAIHDIGGESLEEIDQSLEFLASLNPLVEVFHEFVQHALNAKAASISRLEAKKSALIADAEMKRRVEEQRREIEAMRAEREEAERAAKARSDLLKEIRQLGRNGDAAFLSGCRNRLEEIVPIDEEIAEAISDSMASNKEFAEMRETLDREAERARAEAEKAAEERAKKEREEAEAREKAAAEEEAKKRADQELAERQRVERAQAEARAAEAAIADAVASSRRDGACATPAVRLDRLAHACKTVLPRLKGADATLVTMALAFAQVEVTK